MNPDTPAEGHGEPGRFNKGFREVSGGTRFEVVSGRGVQEAWSAGISPEAGEERREFGVLPHASFVDDEQGEIRRSSDGPEDRVAGRERT